MPAKRDRKGRWQYNRMHIANWPLISVFVAIILYVVVHLYWLDRPLQAWLVAASATAFGVYGWDKWAAAHGWYRVPEVALWLLEAIGGTGGAALAMVLFRHKVSKARFLTPFAVILLAQVVLVYVFRAQLARWW
jgi:uncharacterized membrane protein YsdA (DUF1294 family)